MIRKLSRIPWVYNWIQTLLVDLRLSEELILKHLDYQPGMKILDVGCGTANNAHHFEDSDYLGVDVSESYISFARNRYPNKRFEVLGAEELAGLNEKFARILVWGVFHHMEDSQVESALQAFSRIVSPDSTCLIAESVWPEKRSDLLGWWLRKMDAGNFIRSQAEWRTLFSDYARLISSCPTTMDAFPLLFVAFHFDRKRNVRVGMA